MNWNHLLTISLAALLFVFVQEAAPQEENTRGTWLESRDQGGTPRAKATPNPTPAGSSNNPTTSASSRKPLERKKPSQKPGSAGSASSTSDPKELKPKATPGGLGIGYTVFLGMLDGSFERADPKRNFQSGESIRFLIETNRDGYVYVFNQTDDGPPELVFPNAQIRNGDNQIKAHEPQWVPDGGEITFDAQPGLEKMTIIISEEPLDGLPRGRQLSGKENVSIDSALFTQVTQASPVYEDVKLTAHIKITKAEGTRGVKLKKSDPAPDFILINRKPDQTRLVTSIALRHTGK